MHRLNLQPDDEANWERLRPVLDDVMDELSRRDREAVLQSASWFTRQTHDKLLTRLRLAAAEPGTIDPMAHWFRGSDTPHHAVSSCPDPACCHQPSRDAAARWDRVTWPSARDHSRFVSGLPTDTVEFSPHPGVDLIDVYAFLDRRTHGVRRR